MILPVHSADGNPPVWLTVYEVKCDKCGCSHPDAAITPEASVLHAQQSGWHVPSLFPDEDWHNTRVICPKCRR